MGFVRELAEKVALSSLEPRMELSSTKYCLARTGQEYVAYQPEGGRGFTLDVEPGRYRVLWLNCSTNEGRTEVDMEIEGGEAAFRAPFRAPAVLYLRLQTSSSGG